MALFIVLCMFTGAVAFSKYWKARRAHREKMRKIFLRKWILAKRERKLWEESHRWLFDFDHYEYQKLWDLELANFDLYFMHGGIDIHFSWLEYCEKRDKAKREKND